MPKRRKVTAVRVKELYGVWYYDCIIRGPFATRKLAADAMEECSGARSEQRVDVYDPEKDAQLLNPPGTTPWTNASVLLLMWGKHKEGN